LRLRPWLPAALRRKLPDDASPTARAARRQAGILPTRGHARKVFLLAGCVQPAMLPNVNSATARVLDAAGIQCVLARGAGCCGAIRHHLSDVAGALADMRRNIDAWWPALERGEVEAIVSNASGCGVTIKDYGHALRADPDYADKAKRVSAAARDLSQWLEELVPALRPRLRTAGAPALAFHAPCTLQHGLNLRGLVETHLDALGFKIQPAAAEAHLCCGSAGTYSLLQPEIALQLRDRKLTQLAAVGAPCIISANVGCIQHLQSGTNTPVRHWIEILDEALV
jgi:glycolate oxidase iron-sulfur subunit